MQTELNTLVDILSTQETQKKDYIVPATNMTMHEGQLILTQDATDITYSISNYAHGQLAEKLEIPKKYYDRMRAGAIHLLDENANHWLKEHGKNVLTRTFEMGGNGNVARAFLSDKYALIDNYEVLFETLEAIKQTGIEVDIVGAELSETKMYLKVTCPGVQVEAKELLSRYARTTDVGTGVISGFTLSNSELGAGAFNIMPRAVVLACRNGLVRPDQGLKKFHLGARMDQSIFSESAAVRAANSKLIKEQVKVAVNTFLSKKYLTGLVQHFEELAGAKIEAPIAGVIEVVARDYNISTERKVNILDYFIKGGDTRRMGIVNAITEECQTLQDVDLKNDSEVVAYNLLTNFKDIEARAMKANFTTN